MLLARGLGNRFPLQLSSNTGWDPRLKEVVDADAVSRSNLAALAEEGADRAGHPLGRERAGARLGASQHSRSGRAGAGGADRLRAHRAPSVLSFRGRDEEPRILHGRLPPGGAGRRPGRRGEPPFDDARRLRRRALLAETEYRREIEVTIEPFKGLLLGLYFVSVGAEINPALILSRPGLTLGFAAALIAVKGFILFGLAQAFRLPARASRPDRRTGRYRRPRRRGTRPGR